MKEAHCSRGCRILCTDIILKTRKYDDRRLDPETVTMIEIR